MFRNICHTCWNKYVNELKQQFYKRISRAVPYSKEVIDVLANKVYSVITKSYEHACPIPREGKLVQRAVCGKP